MTVALSPRVATDAVVVAMSARLRNCPALALEEGGALARRLLYGSAAPEEDYERLDAEAVRREHLRRRLFGASTCAAGCSARKTLTARWYGI